MMDEIHGLKRRKLQEESNDTNRRDDDDSSPSHSIEAAAAAAAAAAVEDALPAEIWALILSKYCSYQEVRNCMTVSKFFRHQVPQFMERLYVFSAAELRARGFATRYFPNVEQVFIYSLTGLVEPEESSEEDSEEDSQEDSEEGSARYTMSLCLETARNAVPFLECFRKLKYFHIGGYTPDLEGCRFLALDATHTDLPYDFPQCSTPEGHNAAFRDMMQQLCTAFQSGSIDATKIVGQFGVLPFCFWLSCLDIRPRPCELCPRICQSFPLHLVSQNACCSNILCTPVAERIRLVHARDSTCLRKSNALKYLLGCHELVTKHAPYYPRGYTSINTDIRAVWTITFDESTLDLMKLLCSTGYGCDPALLSNDEKLEGLSDMYNRVERCAGWALAIERSTFDKLNQIGFALCEEDFNIVVYAIGETMLESVWQAMLKK